MQNNYYFLRKLTPILKRKITGWKVAECYSQNKDELIIGLTSPDSTEEFYIRALLRSDFTCLSFPETLHRAKKNSVDLFTGLLNLTVNDIIQFENERAFLMMFDKDTTLLFKMHGNRSNIILYKERAPVSMFNSRLPNDWKLVPDNLHRPIDQSYQAFADAEGDYKELFPTFGKEIVRYFEQRNYDSLSLEDKWDLLNRVLRELNNDYFYISKEELPVFSLLDDFVGEREVFNDPLNAVSIFYVTWLSRHQLVTERSAAIKAIVSEIKKAESYITTTKKRLDKLELENNYRQWADLLMANLHRIKQGQEEAVVDNFYKNNQSLVIKLDSKLSPQKNAERFYQKAKNQHKEVEIHIEGLLKREEVLNEKKELLHKLGQISDIKALRALKPEKTPTKEEKGNKPYHYFNIRGYDVMVGKSARHNDVLLQQYSKKDDLWLHARDVSGSHVIIRTKGTEKIPDDVVEKAAKLAAFNSKRKSDTLCPVIVTPRKFVRKRKGDPPGAVVIDREEVIMVEPTMEIGE